MTFPLNILHIEDSAPDSALVEGLLQSDGLECKVQRIQTRLELLKALDGPAFDIILSDCTLPNFHGLQALEMVHAFTPETPFIFISGTIGEELAIDSLHKGATDYVLKQRLSRLVPAVRRALAESNERSARRVMEERLHQARRLEAIGTLTGGLVHDFKNVLQIIKTHVSLLPIYANDPVKIGEISKNLEKATERGADLMQELLVFARKTDANLALIDITSQVNEMANLLRAGLPPAVQLVVQTPENLPCIFADACQLDRMITNLVMNARDAMPRGGTIVLSAEVVQFDPPPPRSCQLDNVPYLCVKVADTGTGMDEAACRHAFEPFFTTKGVGKGTGLGLSVVFGLMQIHNGFIDLQSRVGEGTTISLFFPLPQRVKVSPEMIKKIPPFQLLGGAYPTGH